MLNGTTALTAASCESQDARDIAMETIAALEAVTNDSIAIAATTGGFFNVFTNV